jgi:hypothetical protein
MAAIKAEHRQAVYVACERIQADAVFRARPHRAKADGVQMTGPAI